MPQEFAIIDIETTGRTGAGQKVTEIAIIIHDGNKIIDDYQTLVNPETSIPFSITQLTGIHDEMVATAPKFYEIARKVFEMTDGRVFVAHNVAFDFGVLKQEFTSLGGAFDREQLCTVKLSRKLLPGHLSYSLGKLCDDLGIAINGRHRAYGDAAATVILFELILEASRKMGVEQLTTESITNIPKIPPLLEVSTYANLPQSTGVYYIYNEDGTLVYVGKSKNIRQRIQSHFNDKKRKEKTMFAVTADIKCHVTGSELIALLFESEEIKKHQPQFNRALKQSKATHGLYTYANQAGIMQLYIGKIQPGNMAILTFPKLGQAKNYLENLVEEYLLCPKYCALEKTNGRCFASLIKKCNGVCDDREPIAEYNARVELMLSEIILKREDFFIIEPGRNENEIGIIQIKQGEYMGYGYVPDTHQNENHEDYDSFIDAKENDADALRIILGYLKMKNKV